MKQYQISYKPHVTGMHVFFKEGALEVREGTKLEYFPLVNEDAWVTNAYGMNLQEAFTDAWRIFQKEHLKKGIEITKEDYETFRKDMELRVKHDRRTIWKITYDYETNEYYVNQYRGNDNQICLEHLGKVVIGYTYSDHHVAEVDIEEDDKAVAVGKGVEKIEKKITEDFCKKVKKAGVNIVKKAVY